MLFHHAELHNVAELIPASGGQGFYLSRVPDAFRLQMHDRAQWTALNNCGCEIRFNLRGDSAKVILRREKSRDGAAPYGLLEVYQGSFQSTYVRTPTVVGEDEIVIEITRRDTPLPLLRNLTEQFQLPFDPELVRIVLPYDWPNVLIDIQGEIEPPRAEQMPALRYLAYGSSITHGGNAFVPTGGYAMRTAHLLGADLLNFGFSGSAHMEAAQADCIVSRTDWNVATLEMGINVVYDWTVERFAAAVDPFLTRIVQSHPDKWIFCIDLFTMKMDVERDEKVNHYRAIVRDIVARLNQPRLRYLSGADLLPASGLSADLIHPSAEGMEIISQRLAALIRAQAEL
ncbi:GDSL-type esterase/lipase family protein [Tengunoibacter tsumagoiensis]|uniref:SGNH hydrolase-type esterase domain-containing protein n=1 Tax=Tengunoibacter tsumagoiensis TaxID=2014871 RepID=A0A402AAF8_9CHLR|nr:GDSL-type esterase/lipase family protein [Tengunoibacter tsumagoiensis]GCE16120.1 hypothetical protein KTT_59790 [Tengunoibacter tsumagoiensis]